MIKGSKEYIADLAKNYLCGEHATPLSAAWHAEENSQVIRCGQNHFPDSVTKLESFTEMIKRGETLPEYIKTNVEKAMARKQGSRKLESTAVTIGGVPAVDLGTGQLIPREMLEGLVRYALKLGLDPTLEHVVLMYGKPYVTLDGYLYHANRTNNPYQLKSRPLTNEEKGTYQIEDGDHAWVSEIIKPQTGSSFVGLGIVTKDEMTEESKKSPGKLKSPVVAKYPWQLAGKRADWQALRRAFPLGETEEVVYDDQGKTAPPIIVED